MASHSNDAVGHVHDVLAFNDAFHVARTFIEEVGGVLISTSDHETGGISVARQVNAAYPEYVWHPEIIANASHSAEYLAYQIVAYNGFFRTYESDVGDDVREFIEKNIVNEGLGIFDATKSEIDLLVSYKSLVLLLVYALADMISKRAQIGVYFEFAKLIIVVYTRSFCCGCEYLCGWRSCRTKVTRESREYRNWKVYQRLLGVGLGFCYQDS